MKRILVTGGNGFLGRPCLARLLEAGFEVHAVSRGAPAAAGVTWHRGDLLVTGVARELVKAVRPSHLLALAWCTEPGVYWTSPENTEWMRAGVELGEAFAESGGERAVFAGTCAEYDWRHGVCSEAVTPTAPATLYGRCKHLLAQSLAAIFQTRGISWSWGRLFFLYGPGEPAERFIPSVIRSLLAGREIACTEGRQLRDFLYVDDAASAMVRLLQSDHAGPLNIASGSAVSVREVAETIGEKLSAPQLLGFGKRPSNEEPYVLADTRLLAALGWRPAFDLGAGLDRAIDWWRQ
jgi:nucleoside-diphosphate-sugar epimerase